MVLHAPHGQLLVAQPLDGTIVQVAVGHLDGQALDRFGLDRIVVVLGGDLDGARLQILDRVVAAVVPKGQLLDARAAGLGNDLVPQADAEHGHLAEQRPRGLDGLGHLARIAGPVRDQHAVGL